MSAAALKARAERRFAARRLVSFGVPALILLYFGYLFFAFDIPGLAGRASMDNAAKLVADSYSHKTHVTRDNRSGAVVIAIEGERKGTYPEGEAPGWVTLGETVRVDLGAGHEVRLGEVVTFDIPGYGVIRAEPGRRGIAVSLPEGPVPGWINAGRNRLTVAAGDGRLTVTRNRSELYRYALGWELFFFTLDSPYHGLGPLELAQRAAQGEAGAILTAFWTNGVWRHGEVAYALFETILMAFLGTMGAALIALPVAFLAAHNFSPLRPLRFLVRRVLDFLRGVDGLIWTIVLARAFGPGPLTGSLAILLTDTGTFGKIFSEALENVDNKQIEGVASTGAPPLLRYRFGVLPQIVPVLLSQVLYYLESNTRSATIIGAITGGGIGLLLTQAINTQKDWEEVTYYIVLIVIMVMAMDSASGWLRRRLIKGE